MTQSTLYTPRANLDGLDLPRDFKLPEMSLVLGDVALLPSLLKTGPGKVAMMSKDRTQVTGKLPDPLAYNSLLPHLFKFSYFVEVEDVATGLLEPCIWALKMFVRCIAEGKTSDLRIFGHILPHQTGAMEKQARYFMLQNARNKLTVHLLNPEINRPAEAIPYLQTSIEADGERVKEPWRTNPRLFAQLGKALTLVGTDDQAAKTALKRALLSSSKLSSEESTRQELGGDLTILVENRVYLARVLRRLGETVEAEDEETWVVRWFRKNPHLMRESLMLELLRPKGATTSPILEALGGPAWLETRKRTAKTDDRYTKQCRTCQAREPLVKLSQCSSCKHIWYCSKECQKKNWHHHKEACREMAANLAKIAKLSLTDPENAQRGMDWELWRNGSHEANNHALASALGLHRDPSRGRTHIVVRLLEHCPKVKVARYKFRIAACGVFRIDDILPEIEQSMSLNKGEGKEYIQSLLDEIDDLNPSVERVPMLDLTMGEGIQTWLGSTATTVSGLRMWQYDPKWRDTVNRGDPPAIMQFKRKSIQEVEHVF